MRGLVELRNYTMLKIVNLKNERQLVSYPLNARAILFIAKLIKLEIITLLCLMQALLSPMGK